ncbi:MAG: hypothetical protein AAF570_07340, partial [Bacteroidota bacterium]
VTERSEELLPGIDFTVDVPTKSITITRDIAGSDALRVTYSFVGISMLREFTQRFTVDVYTIGWTDFDKVLAIPATVIQSRHAQLLEQFNFQNPTSFTFNSYLGQAMIRQIRFLEAAPQPRTSRQKVNDNRWTMHFEVTGMLRTGQSLSGGFGIIENIRTPGQTGSGVQIQPDLG